MSVRLNDSSDSIYCQLRAIAWAAHELEKFLGENSGTTSDWPCDIVCDNAETSDKLTQLLSELHEALKPFRDQLGKA